MVNTSKLTVHEISYELRIASLIHLGAGFTLANVNPVRGDMMVPGNALRGALCTAYLKMFCTNNPLASCDSCTEKCEFLGSILTKETEHGVGLYFGHGDITYENGTGRRVKRLPSISLSRRSKVAQKGRLFFYEAIGNILKISSHLYIVYENDNDYIDGCKSFVAKALRALKGSSIGGRRSWGWGYIENVAYTESIYPLDDISLPVKVPTIILALKTPMPLVDMDIKTNVDRILSDLTDRFMLAQEPPRLREVEVKSFKLTPITGWDLKRKRQRPSNLSLETPKIILKFDQTDAKIAAILKLAYVTGLTPDGYWFTRLGYGNIESVDQSHLGV